MTHRSTPLAFWPGPCSPCRGRPAHRSARSVGRDVAGGLAHKHEDGKWVCKVYGEIGIRRSPAERS